MSVVQNNFKKKEEKIYFTQATEDAIIAYNNATEPAEKSLIYQRDIHFAFFKLTQNLIHTFKFYHTEVNDIEDLQHEAILFLLSKIHKYNHRKNIQDRFVKIIIIEFKEEYISNFEEYVGEVDKVTQEQINTFIASLPHLSVPCKEKLSKITPPKAYSYFGTIAKRWFILNNDTNYKKKKEASPIDEIESSESYSYTIDDVNVNDKLTYFIDEYVKYCSDNLFVIFTKEKDAKIADAILELFKKREHLDIFNKKALYIYIREQVDVKTPKITKIALVLQKIFKEKYSFYLSNGYTNFTKN